MRTIVALSAGTLVFGALAAGCVQEERVPVRRQATTSTVVVSTRPPPEAQPAPLPAATTVNVAPPAYGYGVTEAQPSDGRAEATRAVELASQQIDRLQRIERTDVSRRHEDIDPVIASLQEKRERVLQDLRESEMQGSGGARGRGDLDRDISELQGALQSSFAFAPPPSRGIPQPSPLPPSELH